MRMKLAITFKPVKPPLPIDKGNQLWEYVPTTHREGLPEDHRFLPLQYWSNSCSIRQSTVSIKGGSMVSLQTVDTSSLKVKMVEKRNLSQSCCKWTIPAKLTYVNLLPLMSPDNMTHRWNTVDSRKRKKKESVEPRIILQKQGVTMRPFLHMSAFQLANHNLEMYNITTATVYPRILFPGVSLALCPWTSANNY